MLKAFMPKQPKFFELLSVLTSEAHNAAKILNEIVANPENLDEFASEIHVIENKCDEITHKISNELNETFITPIDREDIFAITNALDDVTDGVDRIASKMKLYKVKSHMKFGPQLAAILLRQTELLNEVVKSMQSDFKKTLEKLVIIRNLETEGDTVFRDSITYLFDNEKDPIEVIKKKEILENFEKAVDKCQTATIAIEGALIKNI
ncbi:MAG: DUF47 family protein [Bacteroidetes bacterium]|nr:DUF47 family protein [Bacteroidota bacterium]